MRVDWRNRNGSNETRSQFAGEQRFISFLRVVNKLTLLDDRSI
jgi:hypothetical protein